MEEGIVISQLQRQFKRHGSGTLMFLLVLSTTAAAQKYEIGLQLSGMHLHKIDEAPFSIGARLNYRFVPWFAADIELSHAPENPSGNFGETIALFGVRAGTRFDRIGVFGAVRPGVIHFGGEFFDLRLEQKTHPIVDVGGMMEYYPNRHTFLRIDAADAIIYYGNARFFDRQNPEPLGTVHNFRPGFGVGFRF